MKKIVILSLYLSLAAHASYASSGKRIVSTKVRKKYREKFNVTEIWLRKGTIGLLVIPVVVYIGYSFYANDRKRDSQQEKKKKAKLMDKERRAAIRAMLGKDTILLTMYNNLQNSTTQDEYMGFIESQINKSSEKEFKFTFPNYFESKGIDNTFSEDYLTEKEKNPRGLRAITIDGTPFKGKTLQSLFEELRKLKYSKKSFKQLRTVALSEVNARFFTLIHDIYVNEKLNIHTAVPQSTKAEIVIKTENSLKKKNAWEVEYVLFITIFSYNKCNKDLAKLRFTAKYSSENPESATCTWVVMPYNT